jgi:hypothetical protein
MMTLNAIEVVDMLDSLFEYVLQGLGMLVILLCLFVPIALYAAGAYLAATVLFTVIDRILFGALPAASAETRSMSVLVPLDASRYKTGFASMDETAQKIQREKRFNR